MICPLILWLSFFWQDIGLNKVISYKSTKLAREKDWTLMATSFWRDHQTKQAFIGFALKVESLGKYCNWIRLLICPELNLILFLIVSFHFCIIQLYARRQHAPKFLQMKRIESIYIISTTIKNEENMDGKGENVIKTWTNLHIHFRRLISMMNGAQISVIFHEWGILKPNYLNSAILAIANNHWITQEIL